jgi:hypothetical protein
MSLRHIFLHRGWVLAIGALLCDGITLAAQPLPAPILMSPALPVTGEAVVLVVEPTCFDVFAPPTVAGNTITLQVGPLIPAPCPVGHEYPLGPLAAGSYTVKEVDFSGDFLGQSVFQVNAPASQLNLLGGTFAVTASWLDAGGRPHSAGAVQMADSSGYCWFFDPGSIELSVKILDGGAINGHFWVFISSATTVGFTVTVSVGVGSCAQPGSPTPCPAKTYTATPGTNQNFFDLGTFASSS